jgi:hypothetical protein
MDPILIVVLTILGVLVVLSLIVLALGSGNVSRIVQMKMAFLRGLRDEKFAGQVEKLMAPPEPAKPVRPDGTPLRVLNLLQREGRLLDFLMEDIGGASDEQVGAGVRDIHQKCQKALKEHLDLEPVIARQEGEKVDVAAGFDPAAIQLTGNVAGQPPFRGTLVHAGWRVRQIKIAKPGEGMDELVVQPAEVELT